jgi:hypothetical protein
MTVSAKERAENHILLLNLLLNDLGTETILGTHFEIDKPPYDQIYPTTWQDFVDKAYIEIEKTGRRLCSLTGYGWLQALERTGRIEEVKAETYKVMAAIKKRLTDGRNKEALVYSSEIAAESRVPEGLVENILGCEFIRSELGKHAPKCERRYPRGFLLRIPINFGMDVDLK